VNAAIDRKEAVTSFDRFYAKDRALLGRYLLVAGCPRDAVEDVAQEAYGRALKHWPEIGERNPEAWVRVVATCIWFDEYRRSVKQHAVGDRLRLVGSTARESHAEASTMKVDVGRRAGTLARPPASCRRAVLPDGRIRRRDCDHTRLDAGEGQS
jgi:DNA-directed RNA polymerase specialized sigma24 family protein